MRRSPLRAFLRWFLLVQFLLFLPVVTGQTPPANDSFTNAFVLSGDAVSAQGNNERASLENGEPPHGLNRGSRSVWWTWTASADDVVTVDTEGSTFDTQLAVYRGDSVSSLVSVGKNDDAAPDRTSRLTFTATSGTAYHIAVDGYQNAYGDILLTLHQGPVLPLITNQPQSRIVLPGASLTFKVGVFGPPLFTYQWQKDGTDLPGATTATLAMGNAANTDAGLYRVVVGNTSGSVTSTVASLEVGFAGITNQPQNAVVAAGYSATFSVSAIGSALVYQWQKEGASIADATNSSLTLTNIQPVDQAAYRVVVSNGLGSATSAGAQLKVIAPYTFGTVAGVLGQYGTNDGVGTGAHLYSPTGIARDRAGNLFVSEFYAHYIRKISPDGTVTTFAGAAMVHGTNDGVGAEARFYGPEGLAIDSADNLYVADNFNYTIRKITPDGTVTTLAGRPEVFGSTDGTNSGALFKQPTALSVDADGYVFVAEWGNSLIRKISPDGVVTTLGVNKSKITSPTGIALDSSGGGFITEENYGNIKAFSANGVFTKLASTTASSYGGATDRSGNYYFRDGSHVLKRLSPDGLVTSLAGTPGVSGNQEGSGTSVLLGNSRCGITVDPAGNIYLADSASAVVRKGVPFAVPVLPQSQGVPPGTPVTLNVGPADPGPYWFQWFFEETPMTGETDTSLVIDSVVRTNSGYYSVMVSNAVGNSVRLHALVRAVAPSILQPPELQTNGASRLRLRGEDGGLPLDLTKLEIQWRDTLPAGSDTNWQSLTAPFSVTNGFVVTDDTNTIAQPIRFYRAVEK